MVAKGAHLHFVLRLRGGGPRAYFLGLGLKVPIGVTEDLDIATAKQVFSEESGIDPSRLIITFKGVEMLDYGRCHPLARRCLDLGSSVLDCFIRYSCFSSASANCFCTQNLCLATWKRLST